MLDFFESYNFETQQNKSKCHFGTKQTLKSTIKQINTCNIIVVMYKCLIFELVTIFTC